MDTFFTFFKKVVIGMVFVVFGMTMVYVPHHFVQYETVPEAHAGAGLVYDPINWFENAYSVVVESAMSLFDSTLNLKEFTLDGIAWAIAKQIVSNMVSSLLDWINSGFEGSPAFVQDLGDFLLQSADEAFGTFIKESAFICSPFRLDVQIAVAVQYDRARTNDTPPTCTLSGVFKNFEAFIEGEFSEGGWDDWFKITSNPSAYTEYGAVLSSQGIAQARVINAKGESYSILNFGDGFLSAKLCQNVAGPTGTTEECVISTAGTTIANAVNKSLGLGQDALVSADEISEIISALLGQLANKAITGASGLLGLSGGTGYTYRGYSRGSFAEELRSGAAAGQAGGVDTGTTTTTGGTTGPGDITFAAGYILNAMTDLNTALNKTNTYINSLQSFANNTRNTEQNRYIATQYLGEAVSLKQNIEREIALIDPIVDKYIALEDEYAGATVERRIEIRSEQSVVVQEFNAVGTTNPSTLEATFARWDTLLAKNVGPLIPACSGFEDVNGNGQWDAFEDDTDCNGIADINEFRCPDGSIVC